MQQNNPSRQLILSVVIGLAFTSFAAAEAREDFFESRVRPLLVKHCGQCHGPKKQESGLRLDSKAGWAKGGDLGPAVTPGKPAESLLIKAVQYTDPDLQMPPDEQLPATAIADLVEWVKTGAFDPRTSAAQAARTARLNVADAPDFWSLGPIKNPTPPVIEPDSWPRTPIDSFILDEMQQHGLSPIADADKRTLIRRATFDLTGLPPTLAEIRRFVTDRSDDAFAVLVDRLLDSPSYGERWGRHWLDVARYADTAGDGADYPVREARKYRDWVIDAFNRDQPFDQFLREQIAGDILAARGPPDDYARRVTATGFLAIGKRYGYKASPDYQHLDFADVIDSLGRSILGLSLGCARCHEHKYDPVSMDDYYALYGILASTRWAFPGGEEQKRPAHFPPLVPPNEVTRLEQAKAEQLARVDQVLAELKRERVELDPRWRAGGVDLDFEIQKTGGRPADPWVCAGPIEVIAEAQSPFSHLHPRGSRGVRIDSGKQTDGLRYVFPNGLRSTPGRKMHFAVDFRSHAAAAEPGAFRFYLGRGVVQSLAVECSATAREFAIRNGAKWEVIRKIEPGVWYTMQIAIDPSKKTYSGVVGSPGDLTAFENKATGPSWDGVVDCFICDAFGHVSGAACSRDLDNLGLQEEPLPALGSEPVAPRPDAPNAEERLAQVEVELEAEQARRKSLAGTPAYEVAYGVSESTPVNSRIQVRGEPQQLGDEVARRNLEVFGGDALPKESSTSGRLELANWLTRPSNPLTDRVFVNRVWQWHFGRGLVNTPSSFGSRGEPPTHPELLDWLASQFRAADYSVKSLHRAIMLSRTYQLASDDHAGNLRIDPENRRLWRYSRRPLDAESIRDAMLAVSGNLDRSAPPPHPFPPVDTWGFTIHRPFHAVYDSNHRSVYLMVQRNRRHPYLALFDGADPNQSVASRQPTTTPTQALFLMNSPFVHEQANGFARRMTAAPGDREEKIRFAFETAHGRAPPAADLEAAVRFFAGYRERLGTTTDAAARENAAWAALARVLLTSNAFLYVD
ncbi:MAG: PSD1 and planctomycete cytochrome C domain-containing protein [Pirellulaceae bacterium]|jgi:mono/diheme cytochrome c family protein|nr:PSD1 and planctomycete cytochrome C domain-containing protein [Pirellulaceae bacterium]MDP7019810.1 PSD1 and planctomycete cytochrome C domain-containing protein [Pirellulaceae bacterium]